MLNRIVAEVPRAACASFAAACVFVLLAACGAEPEPAEPGSTAVSYSLPQPSGATTPEELVFLSDVVARVRLLSASAAVRRYPSEDARGPAPVLAFRFRVIEYLKGSGGSELTVRVLAVNSIPGPDHYIIGASPSPTPDADAALRTAQARLAERDARWDDREAVVFLRLSPLANEPGVYEFTSRAPTSTLDSYAITSDYENAYAPNRAWLPGVAAIRDAAKKDSSAPRYFTSAPPDVVASSSSSSAVTSSVSPSTTATPSTPSLSLSEVKALVAANADMLTKGKDIPGYEDCLNDKFEYDAQYRRYPPEMTFHETRISSGQPAGHRLANPQDGTPGIYYDKWWFTGPDSDLFASRITNDPDSDPITGYAWEEVALRPVPAGEYEVFFKNQPSPWVPCGYNPEAVFNRHKVTVIATAPDGVIHEAFFDPVSLKGGAAGADASNGVLDPTGFTHNGASVDIESIRWESGKVEMRLSPHTGLANHYADFIALDGTVSLRLGFADAAETGAGDSRALKWKICGQPWQDGDLLMLRISEESSGAPYTPGDADCAAATPETSAP